MGRKPVMAVAGLLWISVTLSGCQSCSSCWGRKGSEEGSPPAAWGMTGAIPQVAGWNQQPRGTAGNSLAIPTDPNARSFSAAPQATTTYGGPVGVRPGNAGTPISGLSPANSVQPAASGVSGVPAGFERATPTNSWPMSGSREEPVRQPGPAVTPSPAPLPPPGPPPSSGPTSWNTAPASPGIVPPPAPVMSSAPAPASMAPTSVPPGTARTGMPASTSAATPELPEPPPVPMMAPASKSQTRYLDLAPPPSLPSPPPAPPRPVE